MSVRKYNEHMKIRFYLKEKPELLQLIKDNDSNYKNVKKLKKKELIEYILKQNYGGMFDNTVEQNTGEYNMRRKINKRAMDIVKENVKKLNPVKEVNLNI